MSHSKKPTPRSITARPSPVDKARFATLAAVSGLSESALALKAIRTVLDGNGSLARTSAAAAAREAASDRITIRLRPGDGNAIASRAAMRGMKPSAYLAALVRAHVVANPPLAAPELSALKYSVVVLTGISGHLVRALRISSAGDIRDALLRTHAAVAAHLSYISQQGELELETDEGQRVSKDGQGMLLKDWHLELSAGQYRKSPGDGTARSVKLVHNMVLSMPAPTPPDKVLAAAKTFAREKFALKHRYAMALHTHQQHPHVHLVVKAEDEHGRRLHIDKDLLREWRQDIAQMMRDQGIAANATPRAVRGQGKRSGRDAIFWAQRRADSFALRERVESVVRELSTTGTVRDPAHAKLQESRIAVMAGWMRIAETLEHQGEIVLAGDVRYFAKHLAPVLTDRERLAQEFIRHLRTASTPPRREDLTRNRELERSR